MKKLTRRQFAVLTQVCIWFVMVSVILYFGVSHSFLWPGIAAAVISFATFFSHLQDHKVVFADDDVSP